MEPGGHLHNDEGTEGRRDKGQHKANDVVAAGGLGYLATAEEMPPQGD